MIWGNQALDPELRCFKDGLRSGAPGQRALLPGGGGGPVPGAVPTVPMIKSSAVDGDMNGDVGIGSSKSGYLDRFVWVCLEMGDNENHQFMAKILLDHWKRGCFQTNPYSFV